MQKYSLKFCLLNGYSADERIATQRCLTGVTKAGIKKIIIVICQAFVF